MLFLIFAIGGAVLWVLPETLEPVLTNTKRRMIFCCGLLAIAIVAISQAEFNWWTVAAAICIGNIQYQLGRIDTES